MDKCVTCRYNTNDYVCHPNCYGCNGSSHYEGRKRDMTDINEIAKEIHKNAVAHGWWEETRTFPEIVALIHSELSEALEEYRSNHGVTEVYQEAEKPEGVPIELADAIIRILDYCGYAGIDIVAALERKHEYNKTRPYRHGGKRG